MSSSMAERCDGIYREALGDQMSSFEQTWIRTTFEVYSDAEALAHMLYVDEEVKYSSPSLRRGILDKRIGSALAPMGIKRVAAFALRKRDGVETAHYSRFRKGPLDITISAVNDERSAPRFADYRQERLETLQVCLAFIEQPVSDVAAPLAILFKHGHGSDDVERTVPQFARFEVYDPHNVRIWKRDLLLEQVDFVEQLLAERAENVPDDAGIPRLRASLRQKRSQSR